MMSSVFRMSFYIIIDQFPMSCSPALGGTGIITYIYMYMNIICVKVKGWKADCTVVLPHWRREFHTQTCWIPGRLFTRLVLKTVSCLCLITAVYSCGHLSIALPPSLPPSLSLSLSPRLYSPPLGPTVLAPTARDPPWFRWTVVTTNPLPSSGGGRYLFHTTIAICLSIVLCISFMLLHHLSQFHTNAFVCVHTHTECGIVHVSTVYMYV